MKFTYYNPVKIRFGVDYLEAIKGVAENLKSTRFLLVTSKGFSKRGLSDKVANALGAQLVGVVDEILPNPQLKHLQGIKERLCEFDAIVAVGGGSVIDSAKFLSADNNLSLGMQFRTCENFGDFADSKSSLNPQNFHKYKSHTANTSIVSNANLNVPESSLRGARNEASATKQSKSSEFKSPSESKIDKQINVDSLQVRDLQKAQNLHNRLPRPDCVKSRNDEVGTDCHDFTQSVESRNDKNNDTKPIYAIPTTSGTSSELTHWATIWDNDAFIKHSLSDESLYPKEAIYDPNLTLSLPRETTIYTALDALSHSFESIWNNNANPISTHYALMAIEIILRDLVDLSANLDSLPLRTRIMQASIYAGLAFSNTQTALAHALSYPLTMKFGTPHGLACSFSLPLLLECLPKDSEADALLSPFRERLLGLFEKLEISTNPKEYGLDSAFIEEIFSTLNPRAKNGIFDLERVKNVFKAII